MPGERRLKNLVAKQTFNIAYLSAQSCVETGLPVTRQTWGLLGVEFELTRFTLIHRERMTKSLFIDGSVTAPAMS